MAQADANGCPPILESTLLPNHRPPRHVLLFAAALMVVAPMIAVDAAADPREAARGGRLPIPKPQMPRAAPPALSPGGTLRGPDIERPGVGGTRPPSSRLETPTVCIGGRMMGRSCLCADGRTKPALGMRVVRCPTASRRR